MLVTIVVPGAGGEELVFTCEVVFGNVNISLRHAR